MEIRWQRVIGIVGGLGPYAHLELERLLLEAAAARLGETAAEQDYPEWVLSSRPATPDRTAALRGTGPSPVADLLESLRRLAAAGADFAVIACNTAHAFLDELRRASPLPILDLVGEAAAEAVRRSGPEGLVGVLATTGTLEADLYGRAVRAASPKARAIDLRGLEDGAALQERLVMTPIYGPLVEGRRRGGGIKSGLFRDPRARAPLAEALEEAARRLVAAGADVVLAACTEIPLVLRPEESELPLVDPMRVAARAALAIAAGERPLPT